MRRAPWIILGITGILLVVCAAAGIVAWSLRAASRSDPLPDALWTYDADDKVPTVWTFEDRVYVADNGTVLALDHLSGEIIWKSDPIPAYDNTYGLYPAKDTVIARFDDLQPDYTEGFHARGSNSGEHLWSREGFLGFMDSGIHPLVTAAHIFAVDERRNLVVMERATGKVARELPLGSRVMLQPESAGERVFYMDGERNLVALDDATGEPLWTTPVEGPLVPVNECDCRPAYETYAEGSLLPLWDQETLQAYDAQTGERQWIAPHAPNAKWPPGAEAFFWDDTAVFVRNNSELIRLKEGAFTSKDTYTVYALDAKTGELRFDCTYHGVEAYPLALIEDVFVIGDSRSLYGLDPRDGDVLWRRTLGSSTHREEAIRGQIGYFGSAEHYELVAENDWANTLAAVDLKTGKVRWSHSQRSGDLDFEWLHLTDGALVVQRGDGLVSALSLQD